MARVCALLALLLPVVATEAIACTSSSSESTGNSSLAIRTCGLTVWHKPSSTAAHVEIVGDWNDWKRPGIQPTTQDNGWRVASIDTTAGEHAYAVVEDGVWLTDDNVGLSGTHDGQDVSIGTAANCDLPAITVDDVVTTTDGNATVHATFMSARDAKKIIPASLTATGRDGASLPITSVDAATGKLTFDATGLTRGKYTYTITANDTGGRSAEDARATVWIDASSGTKDVWDARDAVVYQVVIDRYRDSNGNPLAPPAGAGERAGGTLAGLKKALDSGEIEALGATALWISPLYKNPEGSFGGTHGHQYTSYHGYWPIAPRAIDDRFATEKELDAFVADAHSRGIRVLYDVVPNHVHEQHPYAMQHKDWFPQSCVCGQGSCAWSETCWFAPYLPDLDWTNDTAAKAMTDDVVWWFDRFDADGIRIDAVPMMPRGATRRIAAAARQRYQHPGHNLYVLGENFTGPGGYQSLKYDLGPYGLDGAFHFPLMWTLREAIAHELQPMSAVDNTFHAGEDAWKGSGAVMGLMIGNHDVSRFSSESAGNADGDTWTSPPQPIDPTVYAKQRLALAAVLTMPGAPVIYYGDEIGLAGRSDPDCRRVMPGEDTLIAAQTATRDFTRKVGKARSCSRALRRGALTTLLADTEHYVFSRDLDGETAIIVISRRPTGPTTIPLPSTAPTSLVDVVTGEHVEAPGGQLAISADPFTVRVYLAPSDPCSPQ